MKELLCLRSRRPKSALVKSARVQGLSLLKRKLFLVQIVRVRGETLRTLSKLAADVVEVERWKRNTIAVALTAAVSL